MKVATIAMAAALCAISAAAKAEDVACPAAKGAGAMPIDKVIERAEAMGYAIQKTKQSKGCWKIEGFDRNGAEIEIRFDPSTGDVVKPAEWRPGKAAN